MLKASKPMPYPEGMPAQAIVLHTNVSIRARSDQKVNTALGALRHRQTDKVSIMSEPACWSWVKCEHEGLHANE